MKKKYKLNTDVLTTYIYTDFYGAMSHASMPAITKDELTAWEEIEEIIPWALKYINGASWAELIDEETGEVVDSY